MDNSLLIINNFQNDDNSHILKCLTHQENIIEFYCESCYNTPICKECLSSHINHTIIYINKITKNNYINHFKSLKKEYNEEILFLKNELNEILNHYNESYNSSIEKLKKLKKIYGFIHKILQREEYNLEMQIKTIQEDNEDLYILKKKEIENKIILLNKVVNSGIECGFDEICYINKNIYESNKNIKPFNNVIQPFKHINIKINLNGGKSVDIENFEEPFNENLKQYNNLFSFYYNNILDFKYNDIKYKFISIDDFKIIDEEKINYIKHNYELNFALSAKNNLEIPSCGRLLCLNSVAIPNYYIFNSIQTLILHNINEELKDGSIPQVKHLHINVYKYSIKSGVIPNKVEELTLSNISIPINEISIPVNIKILRLNNFDHEINNIVEFIKDLRLGNVKINSKIPNSVTNLTFNNGFKTILENDIIPNSVKSITFGNIIEPLNTDSIPSSVEVIVLNNGFNHTLDKFTIPKTVKTLQINNILKPFDKLPSTIESLILCGGYNQKIDSSIIPNGISLSIYDIQTQLDMDSIPPTLSQLSFCEGFNQKLIKGIIPEGIENLSVYNINESLEMESIPSSLKKLNIKDGYRHEIKPFKVKILSLGNITESLNSNSISESVTQLNICNGFKQKISEGLIPKSVQCLYINDIAHELEPNSIPDSITELHICDGYRFKINKGIINKSIKRLSFGDVLKPLEIGTIPSEVSDLHVHFGKEFKHKMGKDILPKGIVKVSINSKYIKLDEISFPKSVTILKLYNEDIFINENIIKLIPNLKELYLKRSQYELIKERLSSKVNLKII